MMKKAITAEEFDKVVASIQPISDLKVGDKVQWKRGMRMQTCPAYDEVAVVFSTSPAAQTSEEGIPIRHNDFSALYRDDDGEIMEYAHDSRFFERVE